MAQLSDTQLIILSSAAQHPDRIALPLPERLKGGATKIVVGSLLAKGFVEEVDAKRGEPFWPAALNKSSGSGTAEGTEGGIKGAL